MSSRSRLNSGKLLLKTVGSGVGNVVTVGIGRIRPVTDFVAGIPFRSFLTFQFYRNSMDTPVILQKGKANSSGYSI